MPTTGRLQRGAAGLGREALSQDPGRLAAPGMAKERPRATLILITGMNTSRSDVLGIGNTSHQMVKLFHRPSQKRWTVLVLPLLLPPT